MGKLVNTINAACIRQRKLALRSQRNRTAYETTKIGLRQPSSFFQSFERLSCFIRWLKWVKPNRMVSELARIVRGTKTAPVSRFVPKTDGATWERISDGWRFNPLIKLTIWRKARIIALQYNLKPRVHQSNISPYQDKINYTYSVVQPSVTHALRRP